MTIPEMKNACQQIIIAANNLTVSGTQNMMQILGICNTVQRISDGLANLEDKNKSAGEPTRKDDKE